MTIHIDAEFRELLPGLSSEARAELEEVLRAEGCRDPLILWEYDGQTILLDGHNRHAICMAKGIPFETVSKTIAEIPNREAAKEWILRNQLARRNLTHEDFMLALGRLYNQQKAKQGGTGANQHTAQTGQSDPSANTAERLAEEHGVSASTVKRAGALAEGRKPKKRSPRKPAEPAKEAVPAPDTPETSVEPAEALVDGDGREIPPHLTAIFETRGEFERFARTLSTLKGQVRQAIEANPAAWSRFNENTFRAAIDNAHRLLALSGPFIVCSYCGASQSESCDGCKGTGFLTKAQARCVPKEMRL